MKKAVVRIAMGVERIISIFFDRFLNLLISKAECLFLEKKLGKNMQKYIQVLKRDHCFLENVL